MVDSPGDLNVVRPRRHLDGLGLFAGLVVRDVDVGQLREVGVGVDEPSRFPRFEQPNFVDFSENCVVLKQRKLGH